MLVGRTDSESPFLSPAEIKVTVNAFTAIMKDTDSSGISTRNIKMIAPKMYDFNCDGTLPFKKEPILSSPTAIAPTTTAPVTIAPAISTREVQNPDTLVRDTTPAPVVEDAATTPAPVTPAPVAPKTPTITREKTSNTEEPTAKSSSAAGISTFVISVVALLAHFTSTI